MIDFEEAFDSFTGIPLSVLNDSECLIKTGSFCFLWVADDSKTAQITHWINETFDPNQQSRIRILQNRPSTFKLWFLQLFQLSIDIPKVDLVYLRLFPGLKFKGSPTRLLRVDDPFGVSNNPILEFFAYWKRPKLLLARILRTQGFLRSIKSSILIANSKFTLTRFAEVHKIKREKYVINPPVQFDEEIHKRLALKFNSTELDQPYFLIIGGQRQRKDPISLVNDWLRSEQYFRFSIYIVGKLPMEKLAVQAKRAISEQRLRFFSSITSDELAALILQSSGVIFNSSGEGFGNPLAEALFMGRPVICNDLEVFKEVSGPFGHFYPSNNMKQALEVLEETLDNAENYSETAVTERIQYGKRFTKSHAVSIWKSIVEDFQH